MRFRKYCFGQGEMEMKERRKLSGKILTVLLTVMLLVTSMAVSVPAALRITIRDGKVYQNNKPVTNKIVGSKAKGYYYVDKTDFIPSLEDYNAPVFLRPRRFGKSLLISTLACYYDRTKADRFEELFGRTWIGEHPTEEHNRYMVVRYDFSKMVMADDMEGLERNFNDLNCSAVEIMVTHNRDLF